MPNRVTSIRILWSASLFTALASCGPAGDISGTMIAAPHVLALEGARNEALRSAEQEYGVPAELLFVIAHHQGLFELPAAVEEDTGDALDPTTDATADGSDPLAETEVPPDDAAPDPGVDVAEGDALMPEPAMELAADDTDVGLETSLDADADGTDPEAVASPEADFAALAAGDPHAPVQVYGLMYLSLDQVGRAAELSGKSAGDVKSDLAANVAATAALLAADAREAGIDPSSRDLAAWAPVLQLFFGADDAPEVTALMLRDLQDVWAHGFDLTTDDGERLVLVGAEENARKSEADSEDALRPGEYPHIQFIAASSANYGSRHGGHVRFIVIHDMEGTMPGAIAVFRNPGRQASAHYLVRARDGHIVQMVSESSNAWHCGHGYFNSNSIGIEHEGFADRPRGGGYYTSTLYRASSELTCAIAKRYHVPVDRRHIFGHGNTPSNQSSRTLCSDAAANSGRCGGASHHHDPGRYWDWTTYMRLVARCVANRPAPAPAPSPQPAPNPNPAPPAAHTATVKGLIYRGSDDSQRIAGATVRLGSRTVHTDAHGYYEMTRVPEGNHNISASASGYSSKTIARAVRGPETWGSISLTRAAPAGTAKLRGVIYRGDPNHRVAGATVTLSNGRSTHSNSSGVYEIDGLAPGTYTIRATRSGVGSASTRRSVTNGTLTWGSVRL